MEVFMILLSKKKIYIVFMCFLFTIISFQICTKIKDRNIAVETVALPVTNKVIVIDAGHGKPDERC